MTEKPKYDLEERTEKFGEEIIGFAKILPRSLITTPIISQFVRSGTSIGACYSEADCAESKKDFEHKLGICKKEAKETKHWMRMIKFAVPEFSNKADKLWDEANQLQRIFIVIITKSRQNTAKVQNLEN